MFVKQKFNIKEEEKICKIFCDFGWFLWKFFMILADLLLPGPDTAGRNETDPDPDQQIRVLPDTLAWFSIFLRPVIFE